MKTKEQVIKEAYGNLWDFLPSKAKEDALNDFGYIHVDDFYLIENGYNFSNIETKEKSLIFSRHRPKSLQGIEDNAGWIKIESEADLPQKGIDCHYILKSGATGIFVDLDDSQWLTLMGGFVPYWNLKYFTLINLMQMNNEQNLNAGNDASMEQNRLLAEVPSYSVGDKVISSSKSSFRQCGVVWKISEQAVHVRFDDGLFQKFHFKPTHHMQTGIWCLAKAF